MPVSTNPLWPAFLSVLLTVTILLATVASAVFLGRRRLARAEAEFTTRLVRVEDAERERIAAEVHDDFGGHITVIHEILAAFDRGLPDPRPDTAPLGRSLRELQHLHENVRNLAHRLHPTRVDKAGLAHAMRELADQLALETGAAIHLEGLDQKLPGRDAGWALYRVAQEAVRNAVRHGGASVVRVAFGHHQGLLELAVTDNGRGFDVDRVQSSLEGGIGLRLMRERARAVGGVLHIESRAGAGTTIRCRLPDAHLESPDA